MTSPSLPSAATDNELLELAEDVLRKSGYLVAPTALDGIASLLAEDQDNVVVVTAVLSADDALTVEPFLTRALTGRIATASAESKKWDGYVIILASTRPDDDLTEALFSLTYNLHQVRRLIRVGVEATTAAVARSLRAVLPLSEPMGEGGVIDPLTALEQRLVADGLPPSDVSVAMASFRLTAQQSTGADVELSSSDAYDDLPSEDGALGNDDG
jgi:hypothetical protein